MNVLIVNQCATNKGDRAVLFFLLRELCKNGLTDIRVSVTNPHYWSGFNFFPGSNIRFIPFGWRVSSRKRKVPGFFEKNYFRLKKRLYHKILFPLIREATIAGRCPWYARLFCSREYWEALQKADVVIGTGGHRVTTLLAKDAVFPATFDMALAILQNKPLALWSQSIGPFKFQNPRNRKLVATILKKSWRVMPRDEGSLPELESMGVPANAANVSMTRESVLGLFDLVPEIRKPSDREAVMGVAVYMAQARTAEQKEAYAAALSQVVDHAADHGYKVRFFPMEIPDTDRACIDSVIRHCRNQSACSVVEGLPETPEHMRLVSECRLFIGHKTHSVVFALTTGTPVIAIAYHKKTEDFMTQFGLSQYNVDDKKLSGEGLVKLFEMAVSELDTIHAKQMEVAAREGSRVQRDFKSLIDDAQTFISRGTDH